MPTASRARSRRLVIGLLAMASAIGVAGLAPGSARHADAACTIASNLGLGSSGSQVACLQSTLNGLGYNSGPVDGSFGGMTFRAVLAFQRAKGLVVDGLVGHQTATALGIWGTSAGGTTTPTPSTPTPSTPTPSTPAPSGGCTISTSLRLGSSGAQVRCLQAALNAAGYSVGPVDGAFGNQTRRGVMNYQTAKGLIVDGIAGRQTGTALGIWGTTSGSSAGGGTSSGSCAPPSGVPASARQVVVVTSSGSRADVDLVMYDGTKWICARSDMNGRVGRNGVRALPVRRSGDGTTPGGIFPLGSMTAPDGQTFQFFGNGVNPGVLGTWRQVKVGDCWGATPNTAAYNALVTRTAANCVNPDEYLVNFQNSYSRAAIIGANMGANRSGDAPGEPALAAAIFLHHTSYDANGNSKPTSGCVSLNNTDLIYVLQRLRPGQAYFVIR